MPVAFPTELKEKAKMIASQVGLREAARQCGIEEDTVCKWAQREGWMEQFSQAKQAKVLVIEKQGLSSAVSKSGSDIMVGMGEKSKLLSAKVGQKTLKAIHRKADDALIGCASAFKATVDSLAKVHDWGVSTPTTNIAIQINAAQVPDA